MRLIRRDDRLIRAIDAVLDRGMSRLDRYVARPSDAQLHRVREVLNCYSDTAPKRWTDDLISGLKQWSLGPEK
jgi:hypothetical protein